MALFHCQGCWLLFSGFFWLFFGFPHFPWVWPLTRIANYIRTNFLSDHIVAIYPPLVSLLLYLSSAVVRTLSMVTDLAATPHTSIPSSCCWRPTSQNSSRIIIRRCRADSAIIWEHLEGFVKVSKVVSCRICSGGIIHQVIYVLFALRNE